MDITPNLFLTTSLQSSPHAGIITTALAYALKAVNPELAVQRYLKREGDILIAGEHQYRLDQFNRVFIIAAGKAAFPMTKSTCKVIGDRLTHGLIITKEGYADDQGPGPIHQKLRVFEASHPLPDERAISATQKIIKLLNQTQKDDLVICLISGGGSALLTCPASGLMLDDLRQLTDQLLSCGATIQEINSIRKHLDMVKGGQLAQLASPATIITLILSDVVGDALDTIASGPTIYDSSTFAMAYQVLNKYSLLSRTPPRIIAHLERGVKGEIPETPKQGDPIFNSVNNILIGSNRQAAVAAQDYLKSQRLNATIITTELTGEAREKGHWLGVIAKNLVWHNDPFPKPGCLIAGGETTVTITGSGYGGRNQEIALSAVKELASIPNIYLITLATDGGDGPTDAAGAVVTGKTLERAKALGLDPDRYLLQNDSYHFFESLGDLIFTGPTQTNVNDLLFLFAF